MAQPTRWDKCLQHAEISDIGMRRANNQDSYSVELARDEETWRQRGHIFLVADGMGAHAAGELASRIAADNIPLLYLKHHELSAPEALQRAVSETNAEVHRRGQANYDFHNMGTTCSVLTLLPQGAVVAHIGDSRVYRLRGDRFEQLTFDHSLVWEVRASGQLDENTDLAKILPKNVITRSLGPNAVVKVDVEGPFPIEMGDTFLLCSDGLTSKVSDEEIGPILANLAPDEAARVLVDLANLRGGPDNVTVLIAKATGPEVTTQVASTGPLKLGGSQEHQPRGVHPIMWTLMGGCIAVALGMVLLQNYPIAGLSLAVAIALLVINLVQLYRDSTGKVTMQEGQRFGRAPYVQVPCVASSEFVSQLAATMKQLREAAAEQDWVIDWSRLDGLCESADQASRGGQHAKAVRDYARGVRFMMEQLRSQ